MKRVLILGGLLVAFMACNNNSGDSTPGKDSTYNPSSSTDTGQAVPPNTSDTSTGRTPVGANPGGSSNVGTAPGTGTSSSTPGSGHDTSHHR